MNRYLSRLLPLTALLLAIPACSDDSNQQPCTGASCNPPPACTAATDLAGLDEGLQSAYRMDYKAGGDGGLAHITYWTLKAGMPEFDMLPAEEQAKVKKIQGTLLHSLKLPPKADVAGTEITGTLMIKGESGERTQEIVLKVPKDWNGDLVVAGAPGTRNEFSNEATIVPWVLSRGYAYVAGNKGMTNAGADGNATLLNKAHPTQHWGMMMLDLATWAKERLAKVTCKEPAHIYAVGLSNGGYQVRRALEIDEANVAAGGKRIFAGGLSWSGAYHPDAQVLDTDKDGKVTPAEYAAGNTLVGTTERAALTMKWAYDPQTLTNPTAYMENPPFSAAKTAMNAAGFTDPSAWIWGAYNATFDALKAVNPIWKGTGYYNITAYFYRADLLGDDATASAAYTCFPANDKDPPPFYAWLASAKDGGWTDEAISWSMKNANTGTFSVPLISIHGDADGLLGLDANGVAYDAAVKAHGKPEMHRLYVIEHGGHVDYHSDGTLDFDFDGTAGDEGAQDHFIIMQPYAERAFDYLVAWAKDGTAPPASSTVKTDPKNDVLDAAGITF